MEKYIICLLFLVLNMQTTVLSQTGHDPNVIIPPSPNAASLGLYGAIPVGHYTGTAEIKIPIYEMELDGKKFPISLSYHTSGIKVAQEASCVGLGWSLDGIGCIVKQIRGNDDFGGLGFFEENDPLTSEEVAIMNNPNSDDVAKLRLMSKLEDHTNALKDGEPDLFHFNFGNYAGTMFFGRKAQSGIGNGKARPIIEKEKSNLDIEFNYIGDGSWKITDGDGYVYHFRTREITNNKTWASTSNTSPEFVKRNNNLFSSSSIAPYGNTTAWYLDEIISPNNNSIKFRYRSENIYTLMTLNERTTHFKYLHSGRVPSPHTITSNSYSYAEIEQQVISQIETPSGAIYFELDDRYDIEPANSNNPKRIEYVSVENKNEDTLKEIELKYQEQGTKGLYDTYRFFLKEVNDYTSENIRYKMTYDTQSLPSKHSNQTDKWGYYNGQSASGVVWDTKDKQSGINKMTYIPEYQYKKNQTEIVNYLGRKIEVDPTKIKAGSLTSIEYPTGLKTIFTFSPNQVSNSGISSTEDWEYRAGGGVIYKNYRYDFDEEEAEYKEKLIATIKIPQNVKNITLNHRFSYYDNKRPGGWSEDVTDLTYNYIQIKEGSKVLYRFPRDPRTIWLPNSDLIGDDLAGKEITLTLNPNVSEEMVTKFQYLVTASITYDLLVKKQPANYGAGMRVDEITTQESSGEVVKKQFYQYAGGLVMNNSYHHFDYEILEKSSPLALNDYTHATYVVGVSSPHNGFSSSASGYHVGYSKVSEREVYKNTDGRTDYYFHNNADIEQYRGYYFSPPNFPRYKNLDNGILFLKEVFSEANENDAIRTTEYIYSPYNTQSVTGVRVYGIPSFIDTDSRHFALDSYNQRSQTWRLTEEITTDFYNNGEVGSSTKYNYSSTNDLPAQITTIGGDGIMYKMIYKYPTDYQNAIADKLKNRNMINVKLETIKADVSHVIGGGKTEYTDTLGLLLPKTYHQLNPPQGVMLPNYSSHFRKIYSIDRYNKFGKVMQATSQNQIPAVYLWSYFGQYPIAEIKNATYNQITAIISESTIAAIMSKDQPADSDWNLINSLRTNTTLSNCQITTYKYRPLVGLLETTTPQNITVYYDYDGNGRLQEIYFYENNDKSKRRRVERYDYHFKQ